MFPSQEPGVAKKQGPIAWESRVEKPIIPAWSKGSRLKMSWLRLQLLSSPLPKAHTLGLIPLRSQTSVPICLKSATRGGTRFTTSLLLTKRNAELIRPDDTRPSNLILNLRQKKKVSSFYQMAPSGTKTLGDASAYKSMGALKLRFTAKLALARVERAPRGKDQITVFFSQWPHAPPSECPVTSNLQSPPQLARALETSLTAAGKLEVKDLRNPPWASTPMPEGANQTGEGSNSKFRTHPATDPVPLYTRATLRCTVFTATYPKP